MSSMPPSIISAAWSERRSGRTDRRPNDHRPETERDRSRLLHSPSFRRLQGKTQVLGITESDFHRTRLTHSLEVAQISRGIVYELHHQADQVGRSLSEILPDIPVIETICFGHDLGHPPFGHSGEVALNYVMRDAGGFEGNGQSLRLLSRLELHTLGFGLDLTRRVLLGVLKYPARYSVVRRRELATPPTDATALRRDDWKPPKCYLDTEAEVVDWILAPLSTADRDRFVSLSKQPTATNHGKTQYKSFDAGIMELADDIAYGTHDFEDAVSLHLITREHWSEVSTALDSDWAKSYQLDPNELESQLFDTRRGLRSGRRKQAIGAIINALVSSARVSIRHEFESPLLRFCPMLTEPARRFLDALMDVAYRHVVRSQSVQTLEYRGRHLIVSMFDALESDWECLINPAFCTWIREFKDVRRGVCDYIAGMTDAYASRVYERLFIPRHGTVFERL
jgi:dGTPase